MKKIAFVIFSHTGNTDSVAEKLKKVVGQNGLEVDYYRLQVKGGYDPNKDNGRSIEFEKLPDLKPYDVILFGGPVQAFNLNYVSKVYLKKKVKDLSGKKIVLLTTEHFPFAWMGGNRAIKQMTKLCQSKGAEVLGGGVINWSRKNREEQIGEATKNLSGLIVD